MGLFEDHLGKDVTTWRDQEVLIQATCKRIVTNDYRNCRQPKQCSHRPNLIYNFVLELKLKTGLERTPDSIPLGLRSTMWHILSPNPENENCSDTNASFHCIALLENTPEERSISSPGSLKGFSTKVLSKTLSHLSESLLATNLS